jgi:2-polyprenyl-3-methyl-5-hydroxy-6-metoxy-1,4-benzoquinol methylase
MPVDLLELEQGVDPADHWYYRTKADALLRSLERHSVAPRQITDVGAGSGFFSSVLLDRFPQARARCVDPNYSDEQLAAGSQRLEFVREGSGPADLYLFMDVLEHVEDDRALLDAYLDQAPAGSWFFVSVPAMSFLWSGHDVYLGHYRRYTLAQIEAVVRSSGLRVVSGRYLYGATFPVVSAVRLLSRSKEAKSDMKPVRPAVNTTLTRTLAVENRLPGNRLAGSTAVVLARR